MRKCSATLDVFKEVLELNGSDQIVDVVGAPNLERYRTAAGECFRICIQNLQSTVATLENYRPAHSSPLKESFTGFRWDLERLIELTHTTTVSPRERTLLTSTPAYSSGKSVSQLWFDSVRNVSYLLAMGLECKSVTVSRTD